MTPAQIRGLCLQLAEACLDVEGELETARTNSVRGLLTFLEPASARKHTRRYRRLLLAVKLEATDARSHVSKEWERLLETARKKTK